MPHPKDLPIRGILEPRLVFTIRIRNFGVGQSRDLGDQVDDVHSESINALVKPEFHEVVHGVTNFRVLPVEVGLLPGD